MSKSTIPPEKIVLYDALIASHAALERKGKTTPYTSYNGHMTSFLTKDGSMGLRLSVEDRQAFIETFQTELMVQHGRTMKDFVVVPDEVLADLEKMGNYLQQSFEYVASLKPKPSKKKKA